MSYLNGLLVFPIFFNLSLNLAISSSWSEPQSAPSLVFCWLYTAFPSLAAEIIISLISVLTIWWYPSFGLLEEGVCYDQCILLAKLLLAFVLPHFVLPRPNLPFISGISWLPTFAFQSPIMKKTYFGVLILEGLVGLHRSIQLQLLQHCWLRERLGLLWYWMVFLGNEQRSFCHIWDCIQVLHFGLLCWLWGLLHFF